MGNWILTPIILPLGTGIALLFLWNKTKIQFVLSLVSLSLLVFISSYLVVLGSFGQIQTVQIGDWPFPVGITIVCDMFSALMVFISSLVVWCGCIFCRSGLKKDLHGRGFWPFFHFLIAGVMGAFLTGDLFNLYVWYEVMLISSFVLVALGGEKEQLGNAVKYVIANLLSSILFLSGIALVYGLAKTVNMAHLFILISKNTNLFKAPLALIFISFALKGALFPLFFWLPLTYPGISGGIGAIFAGLLTKVGVYSFIRVYTLFFHQDINWLKDFILVIGSLTMLLGVLGAISENGMKRILSFHIISQVGYMIFGLGLLTIPGIAASVFYIVHHIAVKANLCFIAGIVERVRNTDKLSHLGDLYKNYPLLSVLFLLPAFSLAGIPPLFGFFSKFMLVLEGFRQGYLLISLTSLLVGLFTLYSMTKIWSEGFWKRPLRKIQNKDRLPIPGSLIFPVIVLCIFTVGMGIGSGHLYHLAEIAAGQLLSPDKYLIAVFGK